MFGSPLINSIAMHLLLFVIAWIATVTMLTGILARGEWMGIFSWVLT